MPADILEELRSENEQLRRQRDEAIVRAERAETSIRMARAHLEDGIDPNEQVHALATMDTNLLEEWARLDEQVTQSHEQLSQSIVPPRGDFADSLLYAFTALQPTIQVPDASGTLHPFLSSDPTDFHVDPVSLHYTHTEPRGAIYWDSMTPNNPTPAETPVTVESSSAWQRLTED